MHHEGEEADGLLSAWTTLWHPALLAATGLAPSWQRGDNPPAELADMLILVPGVSQKDLPTGFADRATQEGALLVAGNVPRDELLSRVLEPLGEQAERIDPELAADFLALGYCYLQVELLTRQMRYSTNLDGLPLLQAGGFGGSGGYDRRRSESSGRAVGLFRPAGSGARPLLRGRCLPCSIWS